MDGLDQKTFDKFRGLVYEKSGITLGPQKAALVSARIGKRMRALGLNGFDEYYRYVRQDTSEQEIVHMIDAISTNVTSFFREPDHFDFMREILNKWRQSGQTRFRVWSAASSTGEEPYTIAMVMDDVLGDKGNNVRILATDISTRVLEKCREAVYEREKVQTIPAKLRDRYFDKAGDHGASTFQVKDALKQMILFKRLNLSTPPFPMKGPLDLIFCRNVMIYFDNRVRSALLDEMYRLLKPGGYLMVGHAESLTGIMSSFKSVRPSIYVK